MPDEELGVSRLEGKETRTEGEPPDPPVGIREGEDNPMVRIPCPDTAEQDRIAAELDELLNEVVPRS